jgi:hypothetical protein
MGAADRARQAAETFIVMPTISQHCLAQMTHLMRQSHQDRLGMAIAFLAHPNDGHAAFHRKVREMINP